MCLEATASPFTDKAWERARGGGLSEARSGPAGRPRQGPQLGEQDSGLEEPRDGRVWARPSELCPGEGPRPSAAVNKASFGLSPSCVRALHRGLVPMGV